MDTADWARIKVLMLVRWVRMKIKRGEYMLDSEDGNQPGDLPWRMPRP